MKLFYKPHRRGFTLIELLVVIAIISLLSSVVLAALRDARDKANQKAFRQGMQQLINALELYKVDNGKYPYENTIVSGSSSYLYDIRGNGTEAMPTQGISLDTLLDPYLKDMPKLKSSDTTTNPVYTYVALPIQGLISRTCPGATQNSGYLIQVYNRYPEAYKAVSDWKMLDWGAYPLGTPAKCFTIN